MSISPPVFPSFFMSPINGRLKEINQFPGLPTNWAWVGDANNRPEATDLVNFIQNNHTLSQGKLWIGDGNNKASENQTITIDNLPSLGVTDVPTPTGGFVGKVWEGASSGRPEESSIVGEMFADIGILNAKFLAGQFIMNSGLTASFPAAQFLNALTPGALIKTSSAGTGKLESLVLTQDQILMGGANNAPESRARLGVENLPLLAEGNLWKGTANSIPQSVSTIDIPNLPNLNNGKIWQGNAGNRPTEVSLSDAGIATKNASYILKTPNSNLPNSQALSTLSVLGGILKSDSGGSVHIASGGASVLLDDYVKPSNLLVLQTEIEAQLAAITGYGTLGLLTEFLISIGWTTGYSEYLWNKYKPLRTENKYTDTDNYDKQAGNIWFDANHLGSAGDFRPGLRITSYDSSLIFDNDLFPVSMGLFGYKNPTGTTPAQEGFVWQSYMENDSSNSHYRLPKNFGLYYVGHNKGQIGWDRGEDKLFEYDYHQADFSFYKKVKFQQDVNFLSTGAIKIPVGNTAQRPSNPSTGMVRLNTDI